MIAKRSYIALLGYTKHYFAGTERLASAIGNGGLADIGIVGSEGLIDKRRERDTVLHRVMEPYPLRINRNRLDTLYGMTRPDTTAELTYFFHPDHLGSASWITDLSGQPVQHLQYKPFGGDYIDQQTPNTDYSERFRFTGKERDAETGYDYFGARYYSSSLGIWLSVDPMSDKYPSLSPYVYCADNPMGLVDPKGMNLAEWEISKTGRIEKINDNKHYDDNGNEIDWIFNQKKEHISIDSRFAIRELPLDENTRNNNQIQIFSFKNKEDAKKLYYFWADNSKKEITMCLLNTGSGHVGTDLNNGKTIMTTLFENEYNSSIELISHSHPGPNPYPSYNIWTPSGYVGDINTAHNSQYDYKREVYGVNNGHIYGYSKKTTLPLPGESIKKSYYDYEYRR